MRPLPNDPTSSTPGVSRASDPRRIRGTEPAVVVVALGPARREHARRLASRLDLEQVDRIPAGEGLALLVGPAGLSLLDTGPGAPGPIRADLVGGALGRRLRTGVGRRQPLARALGLSRRAASDGPLRVVDATAGLGGEASLAAALGCHVLAVERSPVIAALLEDALRRASREPALATLVARVELRSAEASHVLAELGDRGRRPAAVLLDPMFPERRKSALVRKQMRVLARLVGPDADARELLGKALDTTAERVIVKRPTGVAPLDPDRAHAPHHAIDGGAIRYDVYLVDRR